MQYLSYIDVWMFLAFSLSYVLGHILGHILGKFRKHACWSLARCDLDLSTLLQYVFALLTPTSLTISYITLFLRFIHDDLKNTS
jgi:hypothetical protein